MSSVNIRKCTCSAFVMCLMLVAVARAHDESVVTDFTGVGLGVAQEVEHWDEGQPWDDYKGWFSVSCTNNSGVEWMDFHFELFVVNDGVENVLIEYNTPYLPWCTQSGMTYDVDNTPVTGATLGMDFASDPVGLGETADFHIYTDNMTDHARSFGVRFWPTPIPEPGSLIMIVPLSMMLITRRR